MLIAEQQELQCHLYILWLAQRMAKLVKCRVHRLQPIQHPPTLLDVVLVLDLNLGGGGGGDQKATTVSVSMCDVQIAPSALQHV
jgi:hypothetical protein